MERALDEPAALPLDPSIFKAYDIRGIVGKTLSAEGIERIGRAIGSEARQRGLSRLVVGRDGRLSGPELSAALARGLRATGCDVIDLGMVPTPVVYYAATELAEGSGLALTGSHNPPDYNGIKMMLGGETLAGAAIQRLRERVAAADYAQGAGGYETLDVLPRYIERITEDVHPGRPLRVVLDCGNGVAGNTAPRLLRALGCELTELYCEVDGHFPNHHPDPSQPANLADLIAAVAEHQADLGLAFDGDGDRLGVIASDGTVIWPDRLMMLYAADLLARNPGATIIYDVKCTGNLPKVIAEHGGTPLMWKTGHSLVKAKLKETGALLAGEMSGHLFFKERWYGFDDAMYAAARLLEVLAREPRSSAEVFADLPDSVNTPELQVTTAEGENFALMERLVEAADFGDATVTDIDGLRVDFEDGFGLVRASNTTPCLVLRFEGRDPAALERIQAGFRALMAKVEPGLRLPF